MRFRKREMLWQIKVEPPVSCRIYSGLPGCRLVRLPIV
jgi:hypothetical protein